MIERIRLIDCDGFQIISVDYSDLPEDAYLETMEEVKQLLMALQPETSDSTMLMMANVVNTQTTKDILQKSKEISAVVKRFKKQAYAVINLPEIVRLFPESYGSTYFATTENEARNWLIEEAKRFA